jgi:hypothetical protein
MRKENIALNELNTLLSTIKSMNPENEKIKQFIK